MTMQEFRDYLVKKRKGIQFQHEDDGGAEDFWGEIGSVIQAIDDGGDVAAAAAEVAIEFLVTK